MFNATDNGFSETAKNTRAGYIWGRAARLSRFVYFAVAADF